MNLTNTTLTAAALNDQLKAQGIAASALGPKFLRLVTHLDITDADIEKVCQVLPELLKRAFVA